MDIDWNQDSRTFTVSKDSKLLDKFIPLTNNTFEAQIRQVNMVSKVEKERAMETQRLHEALGHPSDEVLKCMLSNGAIIHTYLTAK
jgi:hypothetical protein